MSRRPRVHAPRLTLIGATIAGLFASEPAALALQGGEDPALLPVLVDKRFGERGRHQLSLALSTSMASKFVEATGGFLTYAYGFTDVIALELGGGFFLGSESSIMQEVRQNFPGQEPPLSDLYQIQFLANADLMLVPIYGKMSFASEFDPSFDLFLVAGAGIAGTRRQVGIDDTKTFDSKITPAFNFGLGFRFYFSRLVALRVEFRDFFYPDPGEGVDGLTFNLMFHGGLQLAFGGEE